MRLWHGSTTTVVPASPAPFDLLPRSQHGGSTVWDTDIAPADLVYLGDAATSIYFSLRTMEKRGGAPVLLEVDVDANALEPDPAYLVTRERLLALGIDGFGETAEDGLAACGRITTRAPVMVLSRLTCHKGMSLGLALQQARIPEHAENWHENSIWREAATAAHAPSMTSGRQWRERFGERVLPTMFVDY